MFWPMPIFDVRKTSVKPEEKKLSRDTVESLVLAADIIQETLDGIPEDWAEGYTPGYRRLIDTIAKNVKVLEEPKKELDITRSL
jgi:hypothetical protein